MNRINFYLEKLSSLPPQLERELHQYLPQKSDEIIIANEDGIARCRYDLFVRWNKNQRREKETFCYRGDYFGITDPHKMLASLVRFFIRKHNCWSVAELYDNTKPKDNPERIILRLVNNKIEKNLLPQFHLMLRNMSLPEYLKQIVSND